MDVGASGKAACRSTLRNHLACLIETVRAFVAQMANGDGAHGGLLSEYPAHVAAPVEFAVPVSHGAHLGTEQASLVDSLVGCAGFLDYWANDWLDHFASLVVFGSRSYSTG